MKFQVLATGINFGLRGKADDNIRNIKHVMKKAFSGFEIMRFNDPVFNEQDNSWHVSKIVLKIVKHNIDASSPENAKLIAHKLTGFPKSKITVLRVS